MIVKTRTNNRIAYFHTFSTRPPPQHHQSQCRPPGSRAPKRQDPHEPQRTHPASNDVSRNTRNGSTRTHLLHTLADVPVHEGTLGVEEVELVVWTGKRRLDYHIWPCRNVNSPKRDQAAEIAVVLFEGIRHRYTEGGCRNTHLESMHKLRVVLARSPPGTQAAGSLQIPSCQRKLSDNASYCNAHNCTLKPVKHQSTN